MANHKQPPSFPCRVASKLARESKRLRYWLACRLTRNSLASIGEKNGTDKVNANHSFAGKSYLDIYEIYLSGLRRRPVSLLEIGVLSGKSLRTWRDYFPNGAIHGIDIDPSTKSHEAERIRIEVGSQDDPEFLGRIFPGETFDLIVDDGSHINTFTVASFQALFHQRLKPGGIYIIEDLACSYDQLQTEHGILDWWPGMKYNDPSKNYDNDRNLMNSFFLALLNDLDHRRGDVEFVHFWAQTCIIKRKN